jgi:hypothetical protein
VKAAHASDMQLVVLSDSHIVLFKAKVVDRKLSLTQDWAKDFASLDVALPTKQAVASRQKGRWRLSIIDANNTLVSLTIQGKVESRSDLGQGESIS